MIFYKQLYQYVIYNKIIPDNQTFEKNLSNTSASSCVTDGIVNALNDRSALLLVLLDYSKALGLINHRLLSSKCVHYGLSDSAVSLITSFLSNRSQCLKFGSYSSYYLPISAEVPQGTIIGSLLFLIYTSDILKCARYCHVNTQIYRSFALRGYRAASDAVYYDLKK